MALKAGLSGTVITPTREQPALNTALTSERGLLLPPLDNALDRYLRDCEVAWSHEAMTVAAE
jgi:dTDP-4-dehydrorhamnose reductase